jgi:signal peptidase I
MVEVNMRRWLNETWQNYKSLLLFLVLMALFRSAIADWNDVPTGSMNPTIIEGDRILVNKLAYDLRIPFTHISVLKRGDPERGDIIIFDSEVSDLRLVKRVTGVPGDVISMDNNVLSINGQELSYQRLPGDAVTVDAIEHLDDRHYTIRTEPRSPVSSFDPVTVPPGYYFVLGDNRDNSADSRYIGFVPRNEIIGRSRSVVLSLDYENYLRPRADRFFKNL